MTGSGGDAFRYRKKDCANSRFRSRQACRDCILAIVTGNIENLIDYIRLKVAREGDDSFPADKRKYLYGGRFFGRAESKG